MYQENNSKKLLDDNKSLQTKIDTLTGINKEKKIGLLKNLKSEIEENKKYLNYDLLPKKDLYTKEDDVAIFFNFKCVSIEKNISEATIDDQTALTMLHDIHTLFLVSNIFLDSCTKNNPTALAKASNMRAMYGNFNEKSLQTIDRFLQFLDKHIQELGKE